MRIVKKKNASEILTTGHCRSPTGMKGKHLLIETTSTYARMGLRNCGNLFRLSRANRWELATKYAVLSYHRNANRRLPGWRLVNSTLDRCNRRKTVGSTGRFYHRSNISVGCYMRWARWFAGVARRLPIGAMPLAHALRQKQAPRYPMCSGTAE